MPKYYVFWETRPLDVCTARYLRFGRVAPQRGAANRARATAADEAPATVVQDADGYVHSFGRSFRGTPTDNQTAHDP